MTNSYHIAASLGRKCDGSHEHQPLLDGRAQEAARYTPELCRAICRGLRRERQAQAEGVRAVAEISSSGQAMPNPQDFHEGVGEAIHQLSPSPGGGAWDDVTGMPLDRKSVQKARAEEIEYVHSKNVWSNITRVEAQRQGMKIIKS